MDKADKLASKVIKEIVRKTDKIDQQINIYKDGSIQECSLAGTNAKTERKTIKKLIESNRLEKTTLEKVFIFEDGDIGVYFVTKEQERTTKVLGFENE